MSETTEPKQTIVSLNEYVALLIVAEVAASVVQRLPSVTTDLAIALVNWKRQSK